MIRVIEREITRGKGYLLIEAIPVCSLISTCSVHFKCSCNRKRVLFIDLLAHPEGFYVCECGFHATWYIYEDLVRFVLVSVPLELCLE